MALFLNPSKRFNENAKLTKIPSKEIRSTRDAIFIDRAYKNGIFKIEKDESPCVYDRAYIFSDINYINCDGEEKVSILRNLIRFLNSMSVDFKITVASEYQDMKEFFKEVFYEPNRERYVDISDGMREWINQKLEEADMHDLNRCMYLTITCRSYSYEEARSYLMGMDTEIHILFEALGSVIVPLNADGRLKGIRKFFWEDDEVPLRFDSDYYDGFMDVVPLSIDASYLNFLTFYGKKETYASVLFARGLNPQLNEEKVIQSLSRVSYPSYLTLDCSPVGRDLLKAKLNRVNTNNERAIAQEMDSKRSRGLMGVGVSYQKEKNKDELESYMDQVDDNDENCFLVDVLVVVTADSEEELAKRVTSMKHVGKEAGVFLDTYNYVQLKALNTALPIGVRQVKHKRAMLSSSLVSMQPFHAQDLYDKGGQLMGMNRTTHHLVFANRKKLSSPHGIIVGHTGGGKSFFIKMTEISQTLLSTTDDLIVIDPQNEFEGVCRVYGGTFIDMTPKSNVFLNPMEIPREVFLSDDRGLKDKFISSVVNWMQAFSASVMINVTVTVDYRAVISRAVRAVYDEYFSKPKLKRQPTIKDVRRVLGEMERTEENSNEKEIAHRLFVALEDFTEGAYDMFANESNADLRSRFVGFGLKNVNRDIWEPVMLTIMFFLSNRMEYNQALQKATRLVVDETQVVTKNESSASMLLDAVVTFRKYGGIVTMAIQNLTRALEIPDLRDMFSNCGYKYFLDQGGVDAMHLAEIQDLSTKEFEELNNDIPGHGVMVWGKKVILLDSRMNMENKLYKQFSTNFHEGTNT